MTHGLYETRARRARRIRWAVVKWILVLAAIGAAGVYGYGSGTTLEQRRVAALNDEIDHLSRRLEDLQAEQGSLQVALAKSNSKLAEVTARYERDVPNGPMAEILEQVRARLDAGVTLERLAFLVGAAQNERDCDGTPVEKRFLLTTPLSTGGNDFVRFADDTIVITGEGAPAFNAAGEEEAWFDPAEPVTLRFEKPSGAVEETVGRLPLSRSLVAGDREHRFKIVAGERGFVRVVADSCAFP